MIDSSRGRAVEILLVEDNPADVRLTEEALSEGKVANVLRVAEDGVVALEMLRDKSRPAPDLILLDLNLPRMSGQEVLQEIKRDADLRRIPVVVLTTSSAERDILKSYELHANCYITKPVDLTQFLAVVKQIDDFWLTVVRLPGDAR
jgi:two-component system, chemotaxis family, response regulator Rcp1